MNSSDNLQPTEAAPEMVTLGDGSVVTREEFDARLKKSMDAWRIRMKPDFDAMKAAERVTTEMLERRVY